MGDTRRPGRGVNSGSIGAAGESLEGDFFLLQKRPFRKDMVEPVVNEWPGDQKWVKGEAGDLDEDSSRRRPLHPAPANNNKTFLSVTDSQSFFSHN